ncbi:MAG: hypothetical protein ABSF90_30895 [Syntrophobacteraceae bacterium]
MFYDGLLREFSELGKLKRNIQKDEEQNREIKERVLQMLMMLSHDLRGTLTSLSAGLKLLIRGTFGKADRTSKKPMLRMVQAGRVVCHDEVVPLDEGTFNEFRS